MNKATQGILATIVGLGSACGSGDSCIAEGTMILSPSGLVSIESLRVGDRVYALDVSSHALVETSITEIRSAKRECVAVGLGGEDRLRCTPDHPLYDPEAEVYAPASEWIEGRRGRLLRVTDDGVSEEIVVQDKVVHSGVFEVFDLSVASEHHNYVAGGVLVHNKSAPIESGLPTLTGPSVGTGDDTESTGGQSSTSGGTQGDASGSSSGSSTGDGSSGTAASSSGTAGSSSGSEGSGTGTGTAGSTSTAG